MSIQSLLANTDRKLPNDRLLLLVDLLAQASEQEAEEPLLFAVDTDGLDEIDFLKQLHFVFETDDGMALVPLLATCAVTAQEEDGLYSIEAFLDEEVRARLAD